MEKSTSQKRGMKTSDPEEPIDEVTKGKDVDQGTVGQNKSVDKQSNVPIVNVPEHTADQFINVLTSELQEMAKKNAELLLKLKSAEGRYVDKSMLAQETKGTIKSLKDQLEQKTNEYENLKENFEAVDEALRENIADLADKTKQYNEIECAMRTLQNECDTQKKSVNELSEKIKQKDSNLANKEHEIELLKVECDKKDSETLKKVEQEQNKEIERLQHFEAVHPALKDQLGELENRLSQSERRNQETEDKLKRAENEIKQLRGDRRAAELEKQNLLLRDKETNRETEKLISNYEQEIKTRKQVEEKQAKEIERLQQFEAVHPALKDQLVELEQKLCQSEHKQVEIQNKLTQAENVIKQLREDMRGAELEKQNLLLRLWKMAGAKLTLNNPNIAALSHGKRPTKLGEEFAELYDNEWTDAFEDVKFEDEREKVSFMLELLKRANELCREVSDEHMNKIKTGICTLTVKDPSRRTSNEQTAQRVISERDNKEQAIPVDVVESSCSNANTLNPRSSPEHAEPRSPSMVSSPDTNMEQRECTEAAAEDEYEIIDKAEQSHDGHTSEQSQTDELHEVVFDFKSFQDDQKKTVMELKKFIEVNLSDQFERVATDVIARKSNIDSKTQDGVSRYIMKCVNICWSMCRLEPPVYISFPKVQDSMQFDTSVYKPYTKSGKHIDYIVWPAVYLYENGPVLGKGVAQGKK